MSDASARPINAQDLDWTNGIVAILKQGRPVGAGFLIAGPDGSPLVVTCAHLLIAAGWPYGAWDEAVHIRYKGGGGQARGKAFPVAAWFRDVSAEDVAVLRLEHPPPPGTRPLPLAAAVDAENVTVAFFGYPQDHDELRGQGQALGLIRDGGRPRLQIRSEQVTEGYSGGPVWRPDTNRVVGLVLAGRQAADAHGRLLFTAFAAPTESLLTIIPDLAQQTLPANPYRGLFAFREDDADYFFGREAVAAQLAAAVARQPLTAVLGPSGSGKSSVVFAGLLPRLRRQGNWTIVSFRPGADPFRALAAALLPALAGHLSEFEQLRQLRQSAAWLETGEVALADVLGRVREKAGEQTKVLLIADQFEELYTLTTAAAKRCRFLDVLLATVPSDAGAGIGRLLITLRADFLGQALAYRPLADALAEHMFPLGPMNGGELEMAIGQPAAKQGVGFQDGLISRILADVGNEPGNLPLLQFALSLLWERQVGRVLTHGAYEAIGEVEGALASRADSVYSALTERQREQARRIFVQLVQPGTGTEDTRRQARKEEIGEGAWTLVQNLAGQRLLVTSVTDDDQEATEVVHEALIQRWGRLRDWMESDRAFRSWQERLRFALQQWLNSAKDGDLLLRGAPLAEAEAWLGSRAPDLSQREREFIEASVRVREAAVKEEAERQRQALAAAETRAREQAAVARQLRRRSWIALGLALLAMAGVILSSFFALQAFRTSRRSLASEMAALSAFNLERDYGLSLRQAYEAVQVGREWGQAPSFEVTNASYRTLSYPITHGILIGHDGPVNSAVFSPDGDLILTGADDQTARLWDSDGQPVAVLEGHSAPVQSVVFSPDGRQILTASADRTARLWDSAGQPGPVLRGHRGEVMSAVFSPDGDQILTASADGTARLWDGAGESVAILEGHSGAVWRAVFSPDGSRILTASADGTARLWDSAGQPVAVLAGHSGGVRSAVFSPDGSRILTASDDGTARLWNSGGQPTAILEGHADGVRSVAFSPDGDQILTASVDRTARLWDSAGQFIAVLEGHTNEVWIAVFSPDGRWILTASADKTARLWDRSGRPDVVLEGHSNVIWSAVFSPDGSRILTSSSDAMARLWDSGKDVAVLEEHGDVVWSAVFNSDRARILTAGDDSTARLWTTAGQLRTILRGHTGAVNSAVFSPDGRQILTASDDGTARLWGSVGQPVAVLAGHTGPVNSAVFSPDGDQILTASDDRTARLWDGAGQPVAILEGHAGAVWSAVFSPDGSQILTAGADRRARLWDRAGQLVAVMEGHADVINSAVFSPDGDQILTGSDDGTARLWDNTGQPVAVLEGHGAGIRHVVFSPDGGQILTASSDMTARLWDSDGRPLAILEGHTGPVWNATFNADGSQILTASLDGTARLWDSSGQPIAVLEGHTGPVWNVAFSRDGSQIITASGDGTARLWPIWRSVEAMMAEAEAALSFLAK